MRYGRTMKIGNVLADLEKRLLRQLMGVERSKVGFEPTTPGRDPVPLTDWGTCRIEKAPADRVDQPAGEQGHEEPPTPVGGRREGGVDGGKALTEDAEKHSCQPWQNGAGDCPESIETPLSTPSSRRGS